MRFYIIVINKFFANSPVTNPIIATAASNLSQNRTKQKDNNHKD